MGQIYQCGLHRFAILTAVATFLLIIAGALVTGNDAGLSVPDWPLSYGGLMPEMVGGVFYEHSHRLVAAVVGVLTIILSLWLWRRESRRWVRYVGLLALLTIIVQAIGGGITVLFFLPPAVSVIHACLAQVFFCLVVSLAVATSPEWVCRKSLFPTDWSKIGLMGLIPLVIFAQLVLGATLRHSGDPRVLVMHLVGALMVVILGVWVVLRLSRDVSRGPTLVLAYLLLGLVLVQLFLGLASLLVGLDPVRQIQPTVVGVWVTTSHVAVGALLLAVALLLVLEFQSETAVSNEKDKLSWQEGIR